MLLNYHIWDNVITYICFFESVYILISTAIFAWSNRRFTMLKLYILKPKCGSIYISSWCLWGEICRYCYVY